MRRCAESEADLLVDGLAYRFDNLREYIRVRRLGHFRGIRFVNAAWTVTRLESERCGKGRRRREEGR